MRIVVTYVDSFMGLFLRTVLTNRVNFALENDGHDATRAVAERATRADCKTRREVRWGDPAVTIITYAFGNDIDLIVMGTRGKTVSNATCSAASRKRWSERHQSRSSPYTSAIGRNSKRR